MEVEDMAMHNSARPLLEANIELGPAGCTPF